MRLSRLATLGVFTALLAQAYRLPADYAERAQELRQWFLAAGGKLHGEIVRQDEFGGFGIVASETLPLGSQVVFVPPSLIMNYEAAMRNDRVAEIINTMYEEGKTAAESNPSGVIARALKGDASSRTLALTVFLLYEAFYHSTSFYKPYMRLLPTDFRHLPAFYKNDELALARAVPIVAEALQTKLTMYEERAALIRSLVMERWPAVFGASGDPAQVRRWNAEIRWAITIVDTRSYPPRFEGDSQALYPVADLLNHAAGANPVTAIIEQVPSYEGGVESRKPSIKGVQLLAHATFRPGEHLVTSYSGGPSDPVKCDADMLVTYGFVQGLKAAECVSLGLVQPGVQRADPILAARRSLMMVAGLTEEPFTQEFRMTATIHNDVPLTDDPRLLQLLRFDVSNLAEIHYTLNNGLNLTEPLTLRNEYSALRTLRESLASMYRSYEPLDEQWKAQGLISGDANANSANSRALLHVYMGTLHALRWGLAQVDYLWGGLLGSSDAATAVRFMNYPSIL